MKRRRRQDGIELNFDGLTDAVTNLVGTLILLVVLVMALTHEAQPHKGGSSSEPPPGPAAGGVRELLFRPPLEHLTHRPGLFFICEGDRVSVVGDNDQIAGAINEARAKRESKASLAEGDFDLELVRTSGAWKAVRKPNSPGETLAEVARAYSKFHRFLRAHAAGEFHAQFYVYSDSFHVFRLLRHPVWKKDYEIGWTPCRAGEPISFGRGGGGSKVQ